MLRVDLRDLARDGTVRFERRVGKDDPLWVDAGVNLDGPVEIELDVTRSATGQILAAGSMEAPLVYECRRCLSRVERGLHVELALVWSPPDEMSEEDGDDGEIRTLDPRARDLDVGEALREELMLAAPRFVLCSEACKGLCVRCGTDLNEGACECEAEELDPRWAALRALDER